MFFNKLLEVLKELNKPEGYYKKIGNLLFLSSKGKMYINNIIRNKDLKCKVCGNDLILKAQVDIVLHEPFLSCKGQKATEITHETGYSLTVDPEMKSPPDIIED